MALGKNINVKKSLGKEEVSEKKHIKKSALKKKLIAKKETKSDVTKKEPWVKDRLARYISEETLKRKTSLRQRYIQQINEEKEKVKQFIIFKIGDENFAIDIDLISEVVPFSGITKIPKAPNHIVGATIVRGQTITAIDLELLFNNVKKSGYQFTISLKSKRLKIGLLVRELPIALKIGGGMIDGDLGDLESVIEDETYIKGIIKHQDQLIFYLDINELVEGDKALVVPDELIEKK